MDLESGYQALQIWNKEAVTNAPVVLKLWLGLMALSFLSSFVFLKAYKGARAIALVVFAGLFFTKFVAPTLGITVFSGLVALTHVTLWPFGILYLLKDLTKKSCSKAYKAWAYWTLLVMAFSLIFDLRDAFIYLNHILR